VILLAFLAVIVVATRFRRTRDPERLVVFRLGRIQRLAGPGITWLLPFADMGWRVDLDKMVPDWRSLSNDELLSRLVELAKQREP
jgi:regulator of protease activity HflC (stomatin/prohibitin superfamily)